jgi:hypothetical protein
MPPRPRYPCTSPLLPHLLRDIERPVDVPPGHGQRRAAPELYCTAVPSFPDGIPFIYLFIYFLISILLSKSAKQHVL